jgi:UDP-glucose 4-epimerase
MSVQKTILITGCAGFIGSNLADRLCVRGYDVRGIDDLSYGIREQVPDAVELHVADIRDKNIYPLFNGVDTVFHFAAKNCITDCQEDPVETSDINVNGTVNVLEAARQAGVRKVVYAESSALYEDSNIFPTPETEEAPRTVYAASKAAARFFALSYERYFNMCLTGLRYFCVYGPRQDYRRTIPPVMCAFIIKLLRGERPLIYGTGGKRRDFVHVDDVNDFHELCIDDDATDGKVFNIGTGSNYSVNEIYEHIADLLGKKMEPEYKNDFPWEAEQTLADISLAESVGWSPKISLDKGLQTLIDYIKTNVLE